MTLGHHATAPPRCYRPVNTRDSTAMRQCSSTGANSGGNIRDDRRGHVTSDNNVDRPIRLRLHLQPSGTARARVPSGGRTAKEESPETLGLASPNGTEPGRDELAGDGHKLVLSVIVSGSALDGLAPGSAVLLR